MHALPENVRATAARACASLPPETAEIFTLRLERWWPDIVGGLADLYPAEQAQATAVRLVEAAAAAYVERSPALRRLDIRRSLRPDWLQEPEMVGYAAYTERFAGDLSGIGDRLDYLDELGVRYLHLMPLLTPREGDNDGGYAVADYRSVRPDLGTMDDLRELTTTLRGRGVSLVMDLVLNHVAAEHEWAQRARAGEQHYRDYFYIYPDRQLPDAYERTLPEVFPDFAPGSFSWDDELDGWVWTTFNEWQWDVNWANPNVLVEYAQIVLFLANAGVEVLRLDAIAFMWKRMGTNCQGQPEVHSITQVLRALARVACPAVAFKAEAIVAPNELVQYLGTSRFTGKVSDLAYHNSLMVQVWSMLATKEVGLAAHALRQLPPAPATSTWITYIRCHDDIGWAISDDDAASVGLRGFDHRYFLSDWYSGDFWGSDADGLVFQENPQTRDRRISGTAASLLGIRAGQGLEEAASGLSALRLAHAMILGWGGLPVIWSGDELATPNDAGWAAEPGHEEDNRWAHRPALDPARVAQRHDGATVAGRAFADLRELVAARARLPHLHASVATRIGDVDDPGVLVTVRNHPLGTFVGLYNVTGQWRSWPWWRLHEHGIPDAVEQISGEPVHRGDDGHVWLPPHGVYWLTQR
ncbi:amylosucrase [Kineosphaera limosa]|uniref:Amylosucrase n=1 Tax=Kineosphaera limosa NBRC 100340 TaxID=1184609 RepID=K6VET2_9MICO|nr:alpha-amylase family protein [Kineosphaera limosa]NYD99340.1 amylosucrase [Kineosphaera limosa]GAB94703.1 amylosucrase [Kineosphaera limosa NBRC 100340]